MKNETIRLDKVKWQWTTKHPFLKLPQFRFVYAMRMCQQHIKKYDPMYYFWRLVYHRMKRKYFTDIPSSTKIGPGFYIGHLGGIEIHKHAVIGSNVNILHGVMLGYSQRGAKKGYPVVGDRVWIGAHATIVGNVHIGSNVLIAPNAYVNFDVPDNSIVLGNPGQIIPSKDACRDYLPEELK